MNWLEEINKSSQSKAPANSKILSFDEYMTIFESNPQNQLRNSALYLRDMFQHYGEDKKGGFNFFSEDHQNSPAVAGQQLVQRKIFQNLINFTEEGFNHKFLLLVGPNGSAKSSLIKKIITATENYSTLDQGALYTFSWIFPVDTYIKGTLGLNNRQSSKTPPSYAHLEDTEISAIINSELKDHPFLLLPLEIRKKMIDETFEKQPNELETIRSTYFYHGDLSKRNRQIFDALLTNYKGDFLSVLKHIRVERYFIDRRYSNSCATIEPQLHVDARLQQITMDRRLSSLPPSLQSLNLFSLSGEITLANRGILEFSDLLKRPLDTFKYLLMTMETRTINLQGILTELDIFFIGSSNEIHFEAFKNHPDFNSFKGRFNFIKVPYLLDYQAEMKIYHDQIKNLHNKCHFEPHALEALSLWSVLTRMRQPRAGHYDDSKAGELAEKLNPLEKALFIADQKIPDYLNSEQEQILLHAYDEITQEFIDDPISYEGKFGISPREIKETIYELASEHKHITFVEVLDYLYDLSNKSNELDFLNIEPQGDYHNPKKFIYHVEHHCLNILDNEVRESLGLIDNRSYEDYLSKYVLNITCLLKNEKIKNNVTGKFEDPDLYFVKEFEHNLHIKEAPEQFRSHILSKLGAWSLDNPNRPIVYTEVLDTLTKQLKESFRNEQKKIIGSIAKNLVFYMAQINQGEKVSLEPEARAQIDNVVKTMHDKFHYSPKGALLSLQYLIKKRYEITR